MNKEKAMENFMNMTRKSWTYEKLTKKEKENLEQLFSSTRLEDTLKGTYSQRWAILNSVYFGFLSALDYTPINWREEEKNCPLF